MWQQCFVLFLSQLCDFRKVRHCRLESNKNITCFLVFLFSNQTCGVPSAIKHQNKFYPCHQRTSTVHYTKGEEMKVYLQFCDHQEMFNRNLGVMTKGSLVLIAQQESRVALYSWPLSLRPESPETFLPLEPMLSSGVQYL